MMPEKLNPIERALVAAAAMPAPQARNVLMLICQGGMTMPVEKPTEGQKHYAKREKFIHQYKAACDRVLKYAKHETLRNIEKHFRENNHTGISSAESDLPSSLAARLTFKGPRFHDELLAALREVALSALTVAGQHLFDELGRDDPFKLPSALATAFLDVRENLLANVPDEVHAEIMASIQDGLEQGETRRELMARIASKFDEISKGRATTIANTETAAAFNYARNKAMRDAGVTHKRWLHSQSPDIREPRNSHVEYDGQVRPIDKPFNIGGVKFMYPSDDSLGAGPEDIINCHCVAVAV
jgi:uncharacterized protein with gpF-like domain